MKRAQRPDAYVAMRLRGQAPWHLAACTQIPPSTPIGCGLLKPATTSIGTSLSLTCPAWGEKPARDPAAGFQDPLDLPQTGDGFRPELERVDRQRRANARSRERHVHLEHAPQLQGQASGAGRLRDAARKRSRVAHGGKLLFRPDRVRVATAELPLAARGNGLHPLAGCPLIARHLFDTSELEFGRHRRWMVTTHQPLLSGRNGPEVDQPFLDGPCRREEHGT